MDALRRVVWRLAAVATLAGCLALPGTASAAVVELDGNPLNVYANGLGNLQARFDGQEAGVFYSPGSNEAHAGLEIRELGPGTATHRLGGSRTLESGPSLSRS